MKIGAEGNVTENLFLNRVDVLSTPPAGLPCLYYFLILKQFLIDLKGIIRIPSFRPKPEATASGIPVPDVGYGFPPGCWSRVWVHEPDRKWAAWLGYPGSTAVVFCDTLDCRWQLSCSLRAGLKL